MISIICALGTNRAIGRGHELPWRIPEDLKRFKRITMGHPIVMGRKTHEAIGRELPGRTNIVITRNPGRRAGGCVVCHSLDDALAAAQDAEAKRHPDKSPEVFIIGGGEIYAQALPRADRLCLTLVDDAPADADTFFPEYSGFQLVSEGETHELDGIRYRFAEYARRR